MGSMQELLGRYQDWQTAGSDGAGGRSGPAGGEQTPQPRHCQFQAGKQIKGNRLGEYDGAQHPNALRRRSLIGGDQLGVWTIKHMMTTRRNGLYCFYSGILFNRHSERAALEGLDSFDSFNDASSRLFFFLFLSNFFTTARMMSSWVLRDGGASRH